MIYMYYLYISYITSETTRSNQSAEEPLEHQGGQRLELPTRRHRHGENPE